jgi:hypothetical protein
LESHPLTLVLPRLILRDEAGFTGNGMLNPEAYFNYASHGLLLEEATALLR